MAQVWPYVQKVETLGKQFYVQPSAGSTQIWPCLPKGSAKNFLKYLSVKLSEVSFCKQFFVRCKSRG
jgi:hypothetical protein